MFQRIRKHLTPSTAIAILALVFAITGGAFAATGNGGSGGAKATASTASPRSTAAAKKKAAPKPVRGPAGPKGATGATGPAGAAGSTGPAGPAGGAGPVGTAGTNGTEGKEGKEGPPGKNGKEGKEGSPWTAGGVLPSGKTETGTWAVNPTSGGIARSPISFAIPLAAPIKNPEGPKGEACGEPGVGACVVHIFKKGEAIPTGCTGKVDAEENVTELGAEPGNFCAWAQFNTGKSPVFVFDSENGKGGPGEEEVGRSGAWIASVPTAEVGGTWAVTAP